MVEIFNTVIEWISNHIVYFFFYFAFINLVTFMMFGFDKQRAIHRQFRVPNAILLGLMALGGTIGGALGMKHFRHKTKKWYYKFSLWLFIFLQLAILFYVFRCVMS